MTVMDVSFLTRMPEGLEVSNEGCPGQYIGRCIVRRSQVLRHILEDSEEGDTCPVPISMDRLDAWRAFRDNDVSSLKVKTSELLKLIMAADILIDVKCLETVCYELSQRLFPRPGPPVAHEADRMADYPNSAAKSIQALELNGSESAAKADDHDDHDATAGTTSGSLEAIQALEALPDQLALSVMRAVTHLPALFAALPPRLHPAALRAHHPSIDSHHSLLLTYPTIGTLHHTMHALSDLGNLTAITLRMRPHGSGNPEDMLPQEFLDHALRLPHLEDVCMEDWRLLRPPLVAASRAEPLATAAAAATAPLTRLALRNSTVSMQALAPRFSTLRTLRVLEVAAASRHDTSGQRCRMVPDDVVALARHISELTALEDLSLEQNNVVPEDWSWIAVALATLTRLRAVNVAGLQIPADVMFCVHDAEGSPPVDSDSAVVSPVWRGIESLNISGNLVCTRKPWLWRALAEMPRLTRLSVADVPMERGVFVNLAEALQAGRAARKDCSESGTAGGEGSMHLGRGGKGPAPFPLVSLDVSGCRIVWGSAFETCMREWPGLQRLVASGTGRLQRMGVPGQGLTAGRAPQAARGLVHVPHLQELVLSDHTGLGAQGLKALAAALGSLTALTLLDISRCHVGADGAAALCPELARLGRLEVLKLAANKVGSRGAGELLAAVVACTRLREVDLARNEVGDGVAVVVKAQLALLQALERLDLRGNNFREAKAALRALSIRRENVMVL